MIPILENISPLQLDSWFWLLWGLYWIYAAQNVQKTKVSESWLRRLQHLAPMFLGLALIFDPQALGVSPHKLESPQSIQAAGSLFTFAGLMFATWARIHLGRYWSGIITLKEGHELIRTGPYRLARHPIYTGFIGGTFGSALSASTFEGWFALVLISLVFVLKSRREETLLTAQFGEKYLLFKREVKAIIPYVY